MNYQTDNLIVYDLEVYKNFFLAGFLLPDGMLVQFEDRELLLKALASMTSAGYELCGFNSNRYDDPVMSEFLNQNSTKAAFDASYAIIQTEVNPWNYNPTYNSVDLMPLLPGRMSLKQIGIRLHHKRLQELPIHWDKELTGSDKHVIREYNKNDLYITKKLLDKIRPELELRGNLSREYGIDVRSKGDAGIAEVVIAKEIAQLEGGDTTPKTMRKAAQKNKNPVVVNAPHWYVQLEQALREGGGKDDHLSHIMRETKGRFNNKIPLDKHGRLSLEKLSNVYLDDKYYKIGAGGLHSVDGPGSVTPGAGEFLMDVDVTSYYPRILLNNNLAPRHVKDNFGAVYQRLVDARLKAKSKGDKVAADRLKITINGTFGKTSDPYSALYDPEVTASITIIGQVSLLVLIAALADAGIRTVSANTDGITVIGKSVNLLNSTVHWWENLTGFNMEYTEYENVYYRDVNNYCANVAGGKGEKQKAKGLFSVKPGVDLRHSLKGNIIAESVKRRLGNSTPIKNTILECTDLNQFLLSHAATGDYKCTWWGDDLGKLVRFYKSTRLTACEIIKTDLVKGRSSNVPQSESCVPVQDLPDILPDDIDYAWYIKEAIKLYETISPHKHSGMNEKARLLTAQGLTPTIVNTAARQRSRGWSKPGETDFNSVTDYEVIGICTGKKAGILAAVSYPRGELFQLYRFQGKLPTRMRKSACKEQGFELVYGANIPYLAFEGEAPTVMAVTDPSQFYQYYTKSELMKAGVTNGS